MSATLISGGMTNVELLRAAVYGHTMEHGVAPSFILMSSDVAQAIFREVGSNNALRGLVNTGAGAEAPMTFNLGGAPIEIGQIVGRNRVELVVDATLLKVRRAQ